MEWWRLRLSRRLKPEDRGWLPVPVQYLVVHWGVWLGAVAAVGLAVDEPAQVWVIVGLIVLAWVVERRLGETVAARLGSDARLVRRYDVFRFPVGRVWIAAFILWAILTLPLAWGVLASGWFRGDGVGVVFGFELLLFSVLRDLASRWRWRRSLGR